MKAIQNLLLVAAMIVGGSAMAQGKLTCPAGTKLNTQNDSTVVYENCVNVASGICDGAVRGTYKAGGNHTIGQCAAGMRTGHWTYFDTQGKKTAEIDFQAGDYHGTRIEYYPNGQKKFEETYDHGRMTAQKNYNDKGVELAPATATKK